jgi:hypothetical protein
VPAAAEELTGSGENDVQQHGYTDRNDDPPFVPVKFFQHLVLLYGL